MASKFHTSPALGAFSVPNPEKFERTPRPMREGARGERWCVYSPKYGYMNPLTGAHVILGRVTADVLCDWATCAEAAGDPETGFTDIAYVREDGQILPFSKCSHEWERFPEPDPKRTEIRVGGVGGDVLVIEAVEDDDPASYVSRAGSFRVSPDVASERRCVRVTARRVDHYGRPRYEPVEEGPVLVSAGGGWFEPGGDLVAFDGLDVNSMVCEPVYEGSGTLAVAFHPIDADRLASADIAAVGVNGPRGWRNPYSEDDYPHHHFFRMNLEGRRVAILARKHEGSRNSNPYERFAELLREEGGARVTVVPEAGDAVEAIKGEANNFGSFRRTTGGGGEPEPLVDGLLYRGQNHTVYGGAGNGKTMLACYLAAGLVERGEAVVYLDRENGAGRILERMRVLGCTEDQLERHFYYFEDPPGTLDDAPDYREMLADVNPALVVFDSLFGFLSAANLDENYGRDVAAWFDAFAPPTLDAATLILDHPPKSGDTARGSSRKLDAVDVSWELSGRFSPESAGTIRLTLKKARDGGLPDKVAYTVGGTPFRFERGESARLKPEERTLAALEDGMTASAWLDASGLKERTFYGHREKLIDAGLVEARGGTYCKVAVAS